MSLCLAVILLSGELLSIRFVVLRRFRPGFFCIVLINSESVIPKSIGSSFHFFSLCLVHACLLSVDRSSNSTYPIVYFNPYRAQENI